MCILKKIVVSIFLLFACNINFAQISDNSSYTKAKIYYSSKSELQTLSKNGIAIDHGIKKATTYIESVFSEKEITIAKKLGFKVEILIKNMQKHILERNESLEKINIKNTGSCPVNITNYTTPSQFNLGSMGGFLTYQEIEQELDDMHTAYPTLITSRAAISSFTTQDGNTLQWVKISDNATTDEPEPEILYTALHHAREPASMQQLIFYMWYLLENYASNAEIKAIVDNTELYFIPVVNPDGYLYNQSTNPSGGGFWRKNRKNNGNGTFGVDNNRNYDYIDSNGNSVWNTSGTSNTTSANNYAGTAPFSEVENQAIKWFVEQHHFGIALNNHTFGNLILFPFGYQTGTQTTDNDTFEAISKKMATENEFSNILSADLYPASGDSDDFMYGETSTHNKILAMTPEIGNSFWPAQTEIISICKSMLFTNLTAAHSVNNYAKITDTQAHFLTTTTGNFNYTIQRLGINGSTDFTVSIVPVTTNITSVGTANQHNGFSLLEKRSGTINYTLNAAIAIGDIIEYTLVTDNGLFTTTQNVSKVFGTPQIVVSENGDNLGNWNTSTSWSSTNSDFVSASSAFTDSNAGNYSNNQNNVLQYANSIDLSTAGIASISFYAKWDIEDDFDYVQFEVSSDNGASWLPQCGNYTQTSVADQGITNQPVYDGFQNEWVQEYIGLSDYLGENIHVRFQLVSDNGVTKDGFYFDDFKVNVIDQSALGNDTFEILDVNLYPNPVKEKITIEIANLAKTTIKIYSITGQLIKQLETNTLSTEVNLKTLISGIYIVKLQTETSSATYKIIKE